MKCFLIAVISSLPQYCESPPKECWQYKTGIEFCGQRSAPFICKKQEEPKVVVQYDCGETTKDIKEVEMSLEEFKKKHPSGIKINK